MMLISSNVKISVQNEDFNTEVELNGIEANTRTGASVCFIGKVRDLPNDPLKVMSLEHYPGMTENALMEIANQAKLKWDLFDIVIIHRIGDLTVGDNIVLVITNSKHRANAFKSCEFIMDYLKTQAPFWKKETTTSSESWVESKSDDFKALSKWDK